MCWYLLVARVYTTLVFMISNVVVQEKHVSTDNVKIVFILVKMYKTSASSQATVVLEFARVIAAAQLDNRVKRLENVVLDTSALEYAHHV